MHLPAKLLEEQRGAIFNVLDADSRFLLGWRMDKDEMMLLKKMWSVLVGFGRVWSVLRLCVPFHSLPSGLVFFLVSEHVYVHAQMLCLLPIDLQMESFSLSVSLLLCLYVSASQRFSSLSRRLSVSTSPCLSLSRRLYESTSLCLSIFTFPSL